MKKFIIWGAVDYGEQAYWYYKDKGEILFYVDENYMRFENGKVFGGIPVYSPEVIVNVEKYTEYDQDMYVYDIKINANLDTANRG